MKLFVIGRNAQESDIVLVSDYVSNYHAEIIQLDNGDMFIVDKSTNGTYVNGNRLTPGKETQIHRGDNITFADVPMNWSLIQDITIPNNVKQIRSIGSHYINDVSIQGPNVSRFHATMRQTIDGKWFICDHSKNGTTVNGHRLAKDHYVQLKKGDVISCAGVPVQNPIKGGNIGSIIGICITVACLFVGVFFGVKAIKDNRILTDEQLYQMYEKSVVMMLCEYHFKVECGTLDITQLPDPDSYNKKTGKFSRSMYDEFVIEGDEISAHNGDGIFYTATGFFIGEDGYIATNRHVAKPWESEKISYGSKSVTIQTAAEDYFRSKLNKLYEMGYAPAFQFISQVKVVGVLDNVLIIPNREFVDEKNAYNCHEVICGENQEEDLAIFKIRSNNLPDNITYVPLNKIKAIEPSQGMHVMTIGFPFGLMLQDVRKTELQANNAGGQISRNDQQYAFGFTAVSYHGASGSPVFDNKGNLLGVLNSGIDSSQGFNYAIRSEYLEKLIAKAKIIK